MKLGYACPRSWRELHILGLTLARFHKAVNEAALVSEGDNLGEEVANVVVGSDLFQNDISIVHQRLNPHEPWHEVTTLGHENSDTRALALLSKEGKHKEGKTLKVASLW